MGMLNSMSSAQPNAECTYDDLVRIYRQNAALSTVDECQHALSALRQLALIQPSEMETSGDRITMRDIEKRIAEAERCLAIASYAAGSVRTTVITPTDWLR